MDVTLMTKVTAEHVPTNELSRILTRAERENWTADVFYFQDRKSATVEIEVTGDDASTHSAALGLITDVLAGVTG